MDGHYSVVDGAAIGSRWLGLGDRTSSASAFCPFSSRAATTVDTNLGVGFQTWQDSLDVGELRGIQQVVDKRVQSPKTMHQQSGWMGLQDSHASEHNNETVGEPQTNAGDGRGPSWW